MSSVAIKTEGTPAWAPAQPWCWASLALALNGLAFVWVRLLGDSASGLRFTLLTVGLLATGVAVWLRLASKAAIVEAQAPARKSLSLLALVLLDLILALSATAVLLMALFSDDFFPWSVGGCVWLWLVVAPWCFARAIYLLRLRATGAPVSAPLESSCLLSLAAVTVFLATWALYLGKDREANCDSLRLMLGVIALALFAVAPVVASPSWLRRVLVSVFIVWHLGGIVTATTAAQPGYWLSMQVWVHMYRPYLEFMYLNNAYRFYSPEPSAATQLWFRAEYMDEKGNVHSRWITLPDMDNSGRSRYILGLQFQRRLALTESVTRTQQPAGVPSRGYKALLEGYPNHPSPMVANYAPPEPYVKQMIESYARHVLSQPHPTNAKLLPVQVKVYRVLHSIMDPESLGRGIDPQDLTLYLPYYMGSFDPNGVLLDPTDSQLYWIFPFLPENPTDMQSRIKCWIYKHAGEDDWIKPPGKMLSRPGGH